MGMMQSLAPPQIGLKTLPGHSCITCYMSHKYVCLEHNKEVESMHQLLRQLMQLWDHLSRHLHARQWGLSPSSAFRQASFPLHAGLILCIPVNFLNFCEVYSSVMLLAASCHQ